MEQAIRELAWNGGWSDTDTGARAAPGSALTCLYVADVGSRVYYLDTDHFVNELAWNGSWSNTNTTAKAAPGSALTCLTAGSSGSRVYRNNRVGGQ
jgi:hypothetical protein